MCGPAKYGEASVKTNHNQLYAHIIIYFIIDYSLFQALIFRAKRDYFIYLSIYRLLSLKDVYKK